MFIQNLLSTFTNNLSLLHHKLCTNYFTCQMVQVSPFTKILSLQYFLTYRCEIALIYHNLFSSQNLHYTVPYSKTLAVEKFGKKVPENIGE